jgi:ribosomal protein S18 acetylase RimI-like enzyme
MDGSDENGVAGLRIDQATSDDISAVISLDEEITGSSKPDFWYKYFFGQATRKNSLFLVARLDDRIVGYSIGSIRAWEFGSPPAGWLHAIGVAHDCRKFGIATRLFNEITGFFRAQQAATVRTMLHIDDHALIAFFRFQGLSAGPFIELEMKLD